jgi:hypothetical protein
MLLAHLWFFAIVKGESRHVEDTGGDQADVWFEGKADFATG